METINLFVRNISYNATNQDLHNLFAEKGTVVSAKIIGDKDTGRSKGYGFVEMQVADKSEGERIIQETDGADLLGREISVQPAKPRE